MDHLQLVREISTVNQLSIPQRVVLARRKRSAQLSSYFRWSSVPDEDEARARTKRVKFTPEVELLEACDEGRYDEVEQLLNKGIDPNVAIDGITALHRSCIDGTEKILRLLLEKGALVNSTDPDGWTPLHVAATCGHTHLAEILVEFGADLMAANEDKELPFEIAEHTLTRQYLENQMLEKGIRQRQIDKIHNEVHAVLHSHTEYVIEKELGLDLPVTPEGATLLHVAVQQGCNKIVRRLIAKNASPYVTDDEGWMAAHVAAYCNNKKALEILATETDFNFNTTNAANETLCDLSDQDEVKNYIRHVQRERMRLALLANVNKNNPFQINSLPNADRQQTPNEEAGSKLESFDDQSDSVAEKRRGSSLSSADDSEDDFSYIYYVNYPVGKNRIEREATNKHSLRKVKRNYPALGPTLFVNEVTPDGTNPTREEPQYKVSYMSDSLSSEASSGSESGNVTSYAVTGDDSHRDTDAIETYHILTDNVSLQTEQVTAIASRNSASSDSIKDSNGTLVDDGENNNIRQAEFDSGYFNSVESGKINNVELDTSNIIDITLSQKEEQFGDNPPKANISHYSESIISDNFELVNHDQLELVHASNFEVQGRESSHSSISEFETINNNLTHSHNAGFPEKYSDTGITTAKNNELNVPDNKKVNETNSAETETSKVPEMDSVSAVEKDTNTRPEMNEKVSIPVTINNFSHIDNDSPYNGDKTRDDNSSTVINRRNSTGFRNSVADSVYRPSHASGSLHELKKRRSQYRDVADLRNEIQPRSEDKFDVPMVAGHFRYSLKQVNEEADSKIMSIISTKKRCSIM